MDKYERPTDKEIAKSWDVFLTPTFPVSSTDSKVLAECVRVDIAKPKGRISIVLTLVEVKDPNREISCWFNVEPIKGKNAKRECRMLKDGKLAKLYRVTIGKNPPRYNRSRQAAGHLVGEQFYIEPVNKSERGLEATSITPKVIKRSDLWGKTGGLYQNRGGNLDKEKTGQCVGNEGVKSGQQVGKEWAEGIATAHASYEATAISNTINQLTNTKVPITPDSSAAVKGESDCTVTRFNIMDGELLGGYYDRVIDETW